MIKTKWFRFFGLICVFSGMFLAVFFGVVLDHDAALYTGDSNIGIIEARGALLPKAFHARWGRHVLMGSAGAEPFMLTRIATWLFSAETFNDWSYGVCLVLSSLLLVGYLRLRGVGFIGGTVAALAAFWTGTNLTLLYPGHLEKFACVMLGTAVLYCLEKLVQTRQWPWSVLAGGALGGMLLEQQDVALFMGVFLGAYAIYAVLRESRHLSSCGGNGSTTKNGVRTLGQFTLLLMPVVVIALLLVGPIIGPTYKRNVSDAAVMGEKSSAVEKWEFSTQWSVPVEESLDLVAPNFFGIRTGERAGPYWGRTGQSAGWKETKQGMRNLRTEGIYVGLIPVCFALIAVLLIGTTDRRRADNASFRDRSFVKSDVVFWGIVTLLTLLLSFGKHFPLYRLFWHLPLMGAIRNPNKHLHLFQIALGIMAAFGVERLLHGNWCRSRPGRRHAWFGLGLFAFSTICFFPGSIMVRSMQGVIGGSFESAGWGQISPVIITNMSNALSRGGLMALIGTVCVGLLVWSRCRGKSASVESPRTLRSEGITAKWLSMGCVLVMIVAMAADQVDYSRDYVKTVDASAMVGQNEVTTFLKENLEGQRVLFFSQAGFYNQWLSTLFRAQLIPSLNAPTLYRLAKDYTEFLNVVGRNPSRLWELAAIGYAIGPIQVYEQIQSSPALKDSFEVVKGFNVYPRNGGVGVEAPPAGTRPQHVVLRYKRGLPRYVMVPGWRIVPDDKACAALASSSFVPRKEILVPPDCIDTLPGKGQGDAASGTVTVVEETASTMKLRTSAETAQVLLISQKHDSDYRATVDGISTPVIRCNFLSLGVPVPPGKHEVVIRYCHSPVGLIIQLSGTVIVLLAGVWLGVIALRSPETHSGDVDD